MSGYGAQPMHPVHRRRRLGRDRSRARCAARYRQERRQRQRHRRQERVQLHDRFCKWSSPQQRPGAPALGHRHIDGAGQRPDGPPCGRDWWDVHADVCRGLGAAPLDGSRKQRGRHPSDRRLLLFSHRHHCLWRKQRVQRGVSDAGGERSGGLALDRVDQVHEVPGLQAHHRRPAERILRDQRHEFHRRRQSRQSDGGQPAQSAETRHRDDSWAVVQGSRHWRRRQRPGRYRQCRQVRARARLWRCVRQRAGHGRRRRLPRAVHGVAQRNARRRADAHSRQADQLEPVRGADQHSCQPQSIERQVLRRRE